MGAAGVWMEDCMTDMISPQHYRTFNLPYLRQLTDEIRAAGMVSIHYFCGNPASKWNLCSIPVRMPWLWKRAKRVS